MTPRQRKQKRQHILRKVNWQEPYRSWNGPMAMLTPSERRVSSKRATRKRCDRTLRYLFGI